MHHNTGFSDDERRQQSPETDITLEKDVRPSEEGEDFPQGRTPSNSIATPLEIFPGCFGDQFNFVASGHKLIGKNGRNGLDSAHVRSKGIRGEKNLHWNESAQDR